MSILKMYSKEEIKELRLKFWNGFKKTHPKKWLFNKTQVNGLVFRFDVDRENAWVILELQHKNEDRRLKIFEILERYKRVLEEGFSEGLVWEFFHEREDNGQEVCRIYTRLGEVDWHRQQQWPEIYDFFFRNMFQLEENFLMIKEVLKEELKK
jgi:hypothetical protein